MSSIASPPSQHTPTPPPHPLLAPSPPHPSLALARVASYPYSVTTRCCVTPGLAAVSTCQSRASEPHLCFPMLLRLATFRGTNRVIIPRCLTLTAVSSQSLSLKLWVCRRRELDSPCISSPDGRLRDPGKEARSLRCALLCSCLDSAVIASVCLFPRTKNHQECYDWTGPHGMQRSQQRLFGIPGCHDVVPPYFLRHGHMVTGIVPVCGCRRCNCLFPSCAQVTRVCRCHPCQKTCRPTSLIW